MYGMVLLRMRRRSMKFAADYLGVKLKCMVFSGRCKVSDRWYEKMGTSDGWYEYEKTTAALKS